jgi:molybdopterin molybdotransferase
VIGFDEASAVVAAAAQPVGTEVVPLGEAAGRVLAEPASACITAPGRDVSMMDGYAVRSADLAAGSARLRVDHEIWPGAADPGLIGEGSCARIFTGAPLPRGADRVVMQEMVRREGEWALFERGDGPAFVRAAGSDFEEGDVLLEAGTRLGPRALIAAAAGDLAELIVWRRPVVAILATGDELVAPGAAARRAGSVPDSISIGLAALVQQWGGRVTSLTLLPDDLESMRTAAKRALEESDLLLVTGGASVGARDFAQRMVEGLELGFAKVAMKPGKPVWFGSARGRHVLGLPGNPTSALVTARLFAAPLLAGMGGLRPGDAWAWHEMALAEPTGAVGDRETFARGRAQDGQVRLAPNQDSGAQRTLAACDVLARLPAGADLKRGDRVPVLTFDQR